MARFAVCLAAFVAFSQLPGGDAALTGVHQRRDNVVAHQKRVQGFRAHKGWPGFKFPADPWGIVVGEDPAAAVALTASSAGTGVGVGDVAATPQVPSVVPVASSSVVPFPTLTALPTASISVASVVNSTLASSTPSSSTSVSKASTSSSKATTSSEPAFAATAAFIAPVSSSAKKTSTKVNTPVFTPEATSTKEAAPVNTPESTPVSSGSNSGSSNSGSSGSGAANPEGDGATSGPTSEEDIQAYLSAHNSIRAKHGASPLTYSQSLAAKAQQWANGCVFKHSGGSLGPFGENLAAGTGNGYGIREAIKSWTDEVSEFNAGNPQPSHFTQVVWKGTTQVGCALQNCNGIFASSFGKAHFYVCEYSPAGNVIGEFAQNVQA